MKMRIHKKNDEPLLEIKTLKFLIMFKVAKSMKIIIKHQLSLNHHIKSIMGDTRKAKKQGN